MTCLAILAIIAVVCAWLFDSRKAKMPYGYEDKTGFHYGKSGKDR